MNEVSNQNIARISHYYRCITIITANRGKTILLAMCTKTTTATSIQLFLDQNGTFLRFLALHCRISRNSIISFDANRLLWTCVPHTDSLPYNSLSIQSINESLTIRMPNGMYRLFSFALDKLHPYETVRCEHKLKSIFCSYFVRKCVSWVFQILVAPAIESISII